MSGFFAISFLPWSIGIGLLSVLFYYCGNWGNTQKKEPWAAILFGIISIVLFASFFHWGIGLFCGFMGIVIMIAFIFEK